MDVAAGADEDFEGEREPGAEYVVAEQFLFVGLVDRFLQDFLLFVEFVADVNVAPIRARHEPCEQHAFNQEMGRTPH